MSEGICREQEAEVVRNKGQRDGNDGENDEAQEECGTAYCDNGEPLLASQTTKGALDATAIVVRPPSININEGPSCEAGFMSI